MLNSECKYTINIEGKQVTFNLMELTKHYYKDTSELKNASIFSSDEIVQSTYKKIEKQLAKKDELFNDKSKIQTLDYISSADNAKTYEQLGFADTNRLTPEYLENEYKLRYISNGLKELGLSVGANDTVKDLVSKYPEAAELEKQVEEDIKINEKTANLSKGLHNVLEKLIRNKGEFNSKIKSDLRQVVTENADYLEGNPNGWYDRFENIIETIYNDISKNNVEIFSELMLGSEKDAPAQIKGNLDIVGIDDTGRIHIYDLKISRDTFADWNDVKRQTVDWQLGMYRALLGQYVNTRDASLNVIPISIGSFNTNGKIELDNVVLNKTNNRLSERTGEWLLPSGKIYQMARKLIPELTDFDYNPQRHDTIMEDLQTLFPEYTIKTSNKNYDFDTLMGIAIKNYGFTSEFEEFTDGNTKIKGNRIYVNPKNADGSLKTEAQLREEFTPIINNYIKFAQDVENNNVVQLRHKIIASIDSHGAQLEMLSPQQQIIVNNVVQPYINGDYRVVGNSEELSSLGLILLQNKRTNSYVLISITSNNLLANYDNDTLYQDLEFIKGLVFFNHFKKELDLDLNQIKDIVVYNLEGNQVEYKGLAEAYDMYNERMAKQNLKNNLSTHNLLPIEKKSAEELREIQRNSMERFSEAEKKTVQGIMAKYNENFETISLNKLKLLSKDLIKAFPELANQTWKSGFNFSSSTEMFFAMVQTLLLVKSEQIPIGDFAGLNNFNVQFSSVKDLFRGVFTNNESDYNKANKKIGSVIDGLKTITPDRVGSKDLQNINIMMSGTNSFIRQMLYKESSELSGMTREYFDKIGFSKLQQYTVGDFRNKSKHMWVTEADGNISTKWQLKNPYAENSEVDLSDAEREYAKNILFAINKRKLNLSKKEIEDIDITSLDSMKKSSLSAYAKIEKAIADETYFKMPLIRSQEIDRNARYVKRGYKGLLKMANNFGDELNDFVNTRELEASELVNIRQQLGYFEMYDVYAKQTDKFKEEVLNDKGSDYFELDLDTIAHRVIFSQIRKEMVDNILPVINSYVWWMKLQSGKQNQDISKELEYVANRIKTALADETIVDPEWEDVVKAASVAKRITTAGMLAFRPALFVKEMVIGMYKGIALASTKIYGGDQFTLKDFMLAVTKLTTIDHKFAPEWNLIDGINNEYGFANRDTNSIYKKLQTNRRGAMQGLGPWMYSMNTIPDYYNRLALFLAKMIHDGSYEAHSLDDNGHIIYDPVKDKRFEHYFANRDKYKNPDENNKIKYLSSTTDRKYNSQKAMYDIILKQRSAERIRAGLEGFEDGDIIDNAYSEQERASFKSFTDTVYGYYDADTQAEWHKTWYGILYLQFLQFWPGKMSMWFGSGNKNRMSPIGYHRQKFKMVEGKKVLQWREPVYNDEGHVIDFDEVDTDTGDPAMEWIGTPQEGLAMSMMKTTRDILTGKWSNLKSEELRTRRAIFGLADGALMLLLFGLIEQMLVGIITDHGSDGVLGTTTSFMESVNKKVLSEANIWNNTFGALRSEPAFWTYSTKVAGDMMDLFQGDKTFNKVLARDFRAFELLDYQNLQE